MNLRSHPLFRLLPAPARRFPKASLIFISLTLVSTCWYFLWFNSYYAGSHGVLDEEEASVEEPGWNNQQEPTSGTKILLVSAFFPLPNVKHTQKEYREWLSNFIGRVQSDTYFYATPEISQIASELSAKHPNNRAHLVTNETFIDPFDVPPLAKWRHQYTEMHEWDRERARHTDELYAIWNAKPYLLNAAIENMRKSGRHYDYAFWVDAGSFRRSHPYSLWPDPARVDSVWDDAWRLSMKDRDAFVAPAEGAWRGDFEGRSGLRGKGDLMFFPSFEVPGYEKDIVGWRKEMGPVDMDFSEGTFFGSTPDTIAWYTKTFYKFHDHYITTTPPSATLFNGKRYPPFHFVGKDQTLINAIIFRYPQRFFTVISPVRQGLLPPNTLPPPLAPSPTQPPTPKLPSSQTLSIKPSLHYILSRFFTSLSSKLKSKLRGANGPFGDEWFYFQFWLAAKNERKASCELWDSQSSDNSSGLWVVGKIVRWWEGWVLAMSRGPVYVNGVDVDMELKGRDWTEDQRRGEEIRRMDGGRCRVTRGFPVVRLLEALYGERWIERVRADGE